jgi:hypothetical protein
LGAKDFGFFAWELSEGTPVIVNLRIDQLHETFGPQPTLTGCAANGGFESRVTDTALCMKVFILRFPVRWTSLFGTVLIQPKADFHRRH